MMTGFLLVNKVRYLSPIYTSSPCLSPYLILMAA